MDLTAPVFITLTPQGAVLGRRLADCLGGTCHGRQGLMALIIILIRQLCISVISFLPAGR